MADQNRSIFICLTAALVCACIFVNSSSALAKSSKGNVTNGGKGQGRLKKLERNSAPTLSGTPSDSVLENTFYEFVPTASDRDGDPLIFSIANKPDWADFDPTTGALYGWTTAADVGHYGAIEISVSDQQATAKLAPFAIDVISTALGSVTLQWQPPTENEDGSPLTDLVGYRIYYGIDPAQLNDVVELSNPGLTNYVIDNLTPDLWCFEMTALSGQGQESVPSNQLIVDMR